MDEPESLLKDETHDDAVKGRVHQVVRLVERDVKRRGTKPACSRKGFEQTCRASKDLPKEKDTGSPNAGNEQGPCPWPPRPLGMDPWPPP